MLINHWSMEGGSCWVCGHSALGQERRKKLFVDTWFRACGRCAEARGTLEEIRAARNAGIEELIALAPRERWESQYWQDSWLQVEWAEAPDRTLLRELRVKPYADEYAQATAERLDKRHAEYRKEYAKTRKEQLAENYANGGKEAARDRYLNGGGKEYAKAYYLKKKEAKRLAELAISETKGTVKNG